MPPYSKDGGGAVVDAVGGMVSAAARRDGSCHVYYYVVGDRAGQGAAEHPVAGREPGHAVTGLVHDPGIVGSEPGRQARRWMELFGDWIATKNGMLGTLLAMIESGEIAHAQTQAELLAAIDEILNAGRVTGELRADVTAEDIAASLIGIFTVARPDTAPGQAAC